jgi:hypothetical protein
VVVQDCKWINSKGVRVRAGRRGSTGAPHRQCLGNCRCWCISAH